MAKKDFRNSILEKAKKIRIEEERKREEELLSEGEKYILERKKERGEPELSLGERLLQERFGSLPKVETPEPIVEEIEVEQPQPIVEQIEEEPQAQTDWSANPFAKVKPEVVNEQTDEDRISWYLEKVKDERVEVKGNILEQDLQNTPATMAELANLRSVVTRLQTSLTSLGGGGIGYQEVKQMIEDGDYNIDSADLWALEAALEDYIDSAIASRLDSANLIGEFTTDDIEEAGNLYYTQARFDSAFADKTTTDLAEGSNLYYTTARFDSDFATKDIHDSAAIQAQIDSAIAAADLDLSGKTTTDLAEGSNLYYTQARFDSAFAGKSTTDLSEGSNLYYTKARHDSDFDIRLALKNTDDLTEGSSNLYYSSTLFDADFLEKSTDSLSEGSTNLYYTDARVTALVDSAYVQSRVTLEAGVHFKGVISFADSDAPANPEAGDLYIADSDGIANASWVGIAGTLIEAQHGVVWANADSSWHELGNTSVDTSVYVEKGGDNMTGTLDMDAGDINIKYGKLDVWEGDIVISDPDAGILTDNVYSRTASAADYVTIYQGANAKLAMKSLENVSYQAMTYPNNTATTVASSGTASTLIHKGYVDSADGLRVLKSGDTMTGALSVDVGGDSNEAAFKIVDGATSELTITGKGKMEWSLDGDAIFTKNGKAYFEFKELSNGTPQMDFTSWLRFADTGIQIGPNYSTQISDGYIYIDNNAKSGGEARIELVGGAYIATNRIRPAPDRFGEGVNFFGDVTFEIGPNENAMKIDRMEELVEMHVPVHMKDNKITDLATPTSNNDAANKSYVDSLQGHIKVSSMGQPGGITVGGMYYDTYTGALILKVS